MASFLKLRAHLPAYLKFITLFAVSITGVRGWGDFNTKLTKVAASNNMSADFDSLLTVSDEAFLVLCVVNY